MDINKFKNMEPMKYLGASPAKKKVAEYLQSPASFSNWIAVEKVDGEYGRVLFSEDKEVLIQGRGISKVTGQYVDKTDHLPHIVEEIAKYTPRGTIILGEFAFDRYDTSSQEVATIFRCLPAKAIARQQDRKIKFYIFDVLAYHGLEVYQMSRLERNTYLRELSNKFAAASYIEVLPWVSAAEAIPLLDEVMSKGGEGLVISNLSEAYYPGARRGTVSLKIKKEMGELTLPVVGFVEPKKEYEGKYPETWEFKENGEPVTAYYFHGWKQGVVVDFEGREVKVTSGISNEDAAWLATDEAKRLLDEGLLKAEITAMERVKSAGEDKYSLRHPVILRLRTDI